MKLRFERKAKKENGGIVTKLFQWAAVICYGSFKILSKIILVSETNILMNSFESMRNCWEL